MLLLAAALLWQWLMPGHKSGMATGMAAPATFPAARSHAAPPAPPALLDSKLAESRGWLAQQGSQQLVLHIASLPASETTAAETFLQQAQQAIGLHNVHVFRLPGTVSASKWQQQAPASASARLAIVYGSFADQASAEAVWARIAPASSQKYFLAA
ncbi:hypothetical protein BA896_019925 [Janthinobacterium lividum]|uniref:SPOR domain-containing protein n=1 Tax=Janthinobacterium lividum TaxID=29581 RepID=A0A1E8PLU8_9BURK|nr:hypothetical protein BA896_019925 [Janthinobacterium lividum]